MVATAQCEEKDASVQIDQVDDKFTKGSLPVRQLSANDHVSRTPEKA